MSHRDWDSCKLLLSRRATVLSRFRLRSNCGVDAIADWAPHLESFACIQRAGKRRPQRVRCPFATPTGRKRGVDQTCC